MTDSTVRDGFRAICSEGNLYSGAMSILKNNPDCLTINRLILILRRLSKLSIIRSFHRFREVVDAIRACEGYGGVLTGSDPCYLRRFETEVIVPIVRQGGDVFLIHAAVVDPVVSFSDLGIERIESLSLEYTHRFVTIQQTVIRCLAQIYPEIHGSASATLQNPSASLLFFRPCIREFRSSDPSENLTVCGHSADLGVAISYAAYLIQKSTGFIAATGTLDGDRICKVGAIDEKIDGIAAELPEIKAVFIPVESTVCHEATWIRTVSHLEFALLDVFSHVRTAIPYKEKLIRWRKILQSDQSYNSFENKHHFWHSISPEMQKLPKRKDDQVEWIRCCHEHQKHLRRIHALTDVIDMYDFIRERCAESPHLKASLVFIRMRVTCAMALTALHRFDPVLSMFPNSDIDRLGSEDERSNYMALKGESAMLMGKLDIASNCFELADQFEASDSLSRLHVYRSRLAMQIEDYEAAQRWLSLGEEARNEYTPHEFSSECYLRLYRLKLAWLTGDVRTSFRMAHELDRAYHGSHFVFWPGPIWRRFGGLAGLEIGEREASLELLARQYTLMRWNHHILSFYSSMARLEWLKEQIRTNDAEIGSTIESCLEPIRHELFACCFSAELDAVQRVLNNGGDLPSLTGLLDQIIARIYEP